MCPEHVVWVNEESRDAQCLTFVIHLSLYISKHSPVLLSYLILKYQIGTWNRAYIIIPTYRFGSCISQKLELGTAWDPCAGCWGSKEALCELGVLRRRETERQTRRGHHLWASHGNTFCNGNVPGGESSWTGKDSRMGMPKINLKRWVEARARTPKPYFASTSSLVLFLFG